MYDPQPSRRYLLRGLWREFKDLASLYSGRCEALGHLGNCRAMQPKKTMETTWKPTWTSQNQLTIRLQQQEIDEKLQSQGAARTFCLAASSTQCCFSKRGMAPAP